MAAPALKRSAIAAAGSAAMAVGYATVIERNAFVVREVTMPVLTPGSTPLRVLHLSDIHMRPAQRHKQAWLRELAGWEPDLVVNTGDNLAHPKAVPAVVQSLGDLLAVPGLFVFGSNDYFAPMLKNPAKYLTDSDHRSHGKPLPWQDLRAAFSERGWLDLTHTRRQVEVAGLTIAIEPMVNIGTEKTRTLGDKWTVVTADGKNSAHFEHTVAVTEDGPVVLTRL